MTFHQNIESAFARKRNLVFSGGVGGGRSSIGVGVKRTRRNILRERESWSKRGPVFVVVVAWRGGRGWVESMESRTHAPESACVVERLSSSVFLKCRNGPLGVVKTFFNCTWKTGSQKGTRFLVDGEADFREADFGGAGLKEW